MDEVLPWRDTVHKCRIVDILGNIFQTGKEQHHVVADSAPYQHDYDRRQSPVDIVYPIGTSYADRAEQEPEQSVGRLEYPCPHHGDRDTGGERGAEDDCPVQRSALGLPVQLDRQGQGDTEFEQDGENSQGQGVAGYLPKDRIVEQRHIVVYANEGLFGCDHVPLEETQEQTVYDWPEYEDAKQDKIGSGEPDERQRVLPCPPGHLWLTELPFAKYFL